MHTSVPKFTRKDMCIYTETVPTVYFCISHMWLEVWKISLSTLYDM